MWNRYTWEGVPAGRVGKDKSQAGKIEEGEGMSLNM